MSVEGVISDKVRDLVFTEQLKEKEGINFCFVTGQKE